MRKYRNSSKPTERETDYSPTYREVSKRGFTDHSIELPQARRTTRVYEGPIGVIAKA